MNEALPILLYSFNEARILKHGSENFCSMLLEFKKKNDS